MKIFDNENWMCPSCGPPNPSKVIHDWKCQICGDPLWIAVEVDGNRFVLERVMAKHLEKEDIILLGESTTGSEVAEVRKEENRITIVFEDQEEISVTPETFFNTFIGFWQESQDD